MASYVCGTWCTWFGFSCDEACTWWTNHEAVVKSPPWKVAEILELERQRMKRLAEEGK